MMSLTPRQAMILNSMAALLIISVTALLMLSLRNIADRLAQPAIPVRIAEFPVIARNPMVCPGELLIWPLTITYTNDGLLMDITRNIRNMDTGVLAIVDGKTYMEKLFIPQEKAGTFNRTVTWRVPQLPPAKYRLITSTQSVTGSSLLQYGVDFEVKVICE